MLIVSNAKYVWTNLYLCGNIVVLEQKDGMINVTGQESPASQAGPEI